MHRTDFSLFHVILYQKQFNSPSQDTPKKNGKKKMGERSHEKPGWLLILDVISPFPSSSPTVFPHTTNNPFKPEEPKELEPFHAFAPSMPGIPLPLHLFTSLPAEA